MDPLVVMGRRLLHNFVTTIIIPTAVTTMLDALYILIMCVKVISRQYTARHVQTRLVMLNIALMVQGAEQRAYAP